MTERGKICLRKIYKNILGNNTDPWYNRGDNNEVENPMNNRSKQIPSGVKRLRQPVILFVLCAAAMVLARISGIAFSFFATDVMYQSSVLPEVLQSVRMILASVSLALGTGAAFWNLLNGKKAILPILTTIGIRIADSLFVILYDVINGAMGKRILVGIIYQSTQILYTVAMLLIGLLIAYLVMKNKNKKMFAMVIATAFIATVDLVYALWGYLSSLIEWEFVTTSSEVSTMLYEGGTLLLCAVFSAAAGVLILKRYKGREKPAKNPAKLLRSDKKQSKV